MKANLPLSSEFNYSSYISQSSTTGFELYCLVCPHNACTSFPPFLNFWSSSSLNVVIDIDLTRCGGLIPRLRGRREKGEGEGGGRRRREKGEGEGAGG